MDIKAAGGAKKDNLVTFFIPSRGSHFHIFLAGDGRGDCGDHSEGEGEVGGEGRMEGESEDEANKKKHRRNRWGACKEHSVVVTENISWHQRKSKSLWKTEIISSGPRSQRTSCMS